MRKLLALSLATIAGAAIAGGPALADAPTKSKPPVALSGKVNNKGEKTVKKGKISVEEDDYYFKPTFLKSKHGTKVTVKLKNEGKNQHTFTIDGLGIDIVLDPDKKATVEVTLPADGALAFYCRFHGPTGTEGSLGMQGAFFSKKGEAVVTGGAGAATATSAPTETTSAPPTTGAPTATTRSSGGGMYGY